MSRSLSSESRVYSENCPSPVWVVGGSRGERQLRTLRRKVALILWAVCLATGIVAGAMLTAAASGGVTSEAQVAGTPQVAKSSQVAGSAQIVALSEGVGWSEAGGSPEVGGSSVIIGAVVDEDGVPVGPGLVSVFSSDYGLVTMDRIHDDGTYRVQSDPGISLLRFEVPGFHPAVLAVSTECERWHLLDVVMRRATAVIRGTVLDPIGIPVERARVVLFSQTESACVASTQSGVDGSFQFTVASGDYVVSAWTSDSVFRPQMAQVGANQRVDIVLAGVPADVRITGRVLDQQGRVVPDVKLCAYTQEGRFVGSTLSDSSGQYSLYLPAGSWEIKAWKNGWTHIGVQMAVDHGRSQVIQDVVLWSSDARVSGMVVNCAGEPVSNVWIEVTRPDSRDWVATVSTDECGTFVLNIASGVWDLSLMAEGFERTTVRVDATAGGGTVLSAEPDLASLRLVVESDTDGFARSRSAQAEV